MLPAGATVPDLDRLTARVFENPDRGSGCRLTAYRIDDGYFVDVVLPGADPAGIDITVNRDVVTVRAERERGDRNRRRPESRGGHRLESQGGPRPESPVFREVTLAETLDTDRLEARYADGVLTLTIPVTGDAESSG